MDKWSAGCQVLADPGHFLELMTLAKLAARRGAVKRNAPRWISALLRYNPLPKTA